MCCSVRNVRSWITYKRWYFRAFQIQPIGDVSDLSFSARGLLFFGVEARSLTTGADEGTAIADPTKSRDSPQARLDTKIRIW